MLGGADNPNGELLSYIIGADIFILISSSSVDNIHSYTCIYAQQKHQMKILFILLR